MSLTPRCEELLRDRERAPLRHPRPADRSGSAQDEHRVRRRRRGRGRRSARPGRRCPSNTTAGPGGVSSCGSAALRLITAPSGARLPRTTAMPRPAATASPSGAMTARSTAAPTCARSSPSVRPVTVSASAVRAAAPARSAAPGRRRRGKLLDEVLAGRAHVRQQRRRRESSSKRSRSSGTPHAAGEREQVDDGVGRAADRHQRAIALSNACAGEDLRRRGAGRARARPRGAPVASAARVPRGRRARAAAAAPGSDIPSASTSAAMVEAVPISLQWPTHGRRRRLELVELLLGSSARRASSSA